MQKQDCKQLKALQADKLCTMQSLQTAEMCKDEKKSYNIKTRHFQK